MLLGVGVILFTFYFNSFCPTAGVFSVEPRVVNIEFFKLGICIFFGRLKSKGVIGVRGDPSIELILFIRLR